MNRQEVIFLNSVFFVIGFTLVFSVLGLLFQTLLSHVAYMVMSVLRVIGGIVIIAFGIMLLLSLKYIIPFMSTEHKLRVNRFSNSYLSALVFGISIAIGWTPCVGAILGSIYVLAASSPGIGFLLLLAFSLGLGIPFLLVGAFTSRLSVFLHRAKRFLKYFNIIGGLFLIGVGLLVATGYIGLISVFLIGQQGPMSLATQLNFLIALLAGIITFLSPCILPLLPAYLSYMAGATSEQARQ